MVCQAGSLRSRGSRRDDRLLKYMEDVPTKAEHFPSPKILLLRRVLLLPGSQLAAHDSEDLCKLAEILAVHSMDLESSNFPDANPVNHSGGTMVE